MPIPLLFAVVGAAGIKAMKDQKNANDTNEVVGYRVKRAKENVENSEKSCKKEVNDLGKRKIDILNGSINTFVIEFEKINNIELTESIGLNESQKIAFNEENIVGLRELQSITSTIITGLLTKSVVGSVSTAALGIYGSEGISSVIGGLGGGVLATGAGATAVVAAPLLGGVAGVLVGAKASKNLDIAKENRAKSIEYEEEMKTVANTYNGIRRRAAMYNRFLIRLQTVFDPLVYDMTQIIKEKGTDFRTFSDDERKCIASAMALAGAIKSVLDTPILDEKGNLTEESGVIIEDTQKKVEEIIA